MWVVNLLAVLVALPVAGTLVFVVWLALAHRRRRGFHRRDGLPGGELDLGARLRYDLAAVKSIFVAIWWQIRARPRHGLLSPAGEPSGPPVLCVHGYLLNGTATWGLRRELRRRGRPTWAVNLGRPHRTLDGYAPRLEKALETLRERSPGQPIDVVGHSMGGVVLRAVLARRPDLAASVRRIVTLAAPHRGTALIEGWRLRTGPEVRQMAAGSDYLQALPTFRESAPQAEVTTVGAAYDLVVYPAGSEHLPGAGNRTLPEVTHLGLLTDPRAIRQVADILCEAPE